MVILFILLVLLAVFFAVCIHISRKSRPDCPNRPTSSIPNTPKPQYSTTLRVYPTVASGFAGCRDGVIYVPSSSNSGEEVIGYYKQENNGDWVVSCDKLFTIGRVHREERIYFDLTGMDKIRPDLHSEIVSAPHGPFWCAAEVADVSKMIIDSESYDAVANYDGNAAEAAAAFICWAYHGSRNKYSDYFFVKL